MRATARILKAPKGYEGAKNEHQERVLEGVAIWAAYYRANIHRFVEDYFHIRLKLFQIFLLYMMNVCSTFVFIACRGRFCKHARVWQIDTARPSFLYRGRERIHPIWPRRLVISGQ